MILVGDGESAQRNAAVADQVPVVHRRGPEFVLLVGFDGFIQSFFSTGAAEERAVFGAEILVEPVIADGEGVGHLSYIEKVRWVPIREGSGGAKFGDCAIQIFGLAADTVDQ